MSVIPSEDIYDVIKIIGRDWLIFARNKLKLEEDDIEECESYGSLKEQRFQMVQTWIRKEGHIATTEKLYALAGRLPSQAASSQQYSENSAMSNLNSKPTNDLQTPVGDINHSLENLDKSKSTRRKNPENSVGKDSPRTASLKSSKTKERATTSTDVPIKAFSEKSTAKEHKRSDSGSTSLSNHSVASEPLSSSGDSINRKNKKPSLLKKAKKSLIRIVRPKEKESNPNNPKAFGNEETPDGARSNMCDTVHWEKVRTVTDKDIKDILQIENRYKTEGSRGCALILNNGFWHNEKRQRDGSKKDIENMKELWSQIGCDIYGGKAHEEKNAADMKNLLKQATKLKKLYSYMVVVIMTHGGIVNGDAVFYGIDDEYVSVTEIRTMFNNVEAPQLVDIPKFFIFQSCCGDKPDRAIDVDYREFQKSMESLTCGDALTGNDTVQTDGKRPTTSDMLLAYATHFNKAAIRHPDNGSWFITAITNIFMLYSQCEHVQEMLLRVNDAMKGKFALYKDEVDGKKDEYHINAMSRSENSLTKKLFLLPGYHKR